jgi:hypothetical protein
MIDVGQEYGQILIDTGAGAGIEGGKGIGAEFYGIGYEPCSVDVKVKGSEYEVYYGDGSHRIFTDLMFRN